MGPNRALAYNVAMNLYARTAKAQNDGTKTKQRHWWLYVLKLEHDKWYIGITSKSVEHRYNQHIASFAGAAWTKEHKPIRIYYEKDLGYCSLEKAQQYENKVTRKYMKKYGGNDVRGGDLSSTEEYTRRFNRIYTKENWQAITTVIFLLLVICYLMVKLYWHS
jgi:predicted GIY-YIG superfamily endonuclease